MEFLSVAVVLTAGLINRLLFVSKSLEHILQFVPDDAFYYLQTAVNVGAVARLTFDGIHPANGFHPLWMAVLVPTASIFTNPVTLLRVSLILGTTANLISAILLYLLLKRLTRRWILSLIGLGVYFLGYYSTRSSLNGLETSLSTLLFILALYLCIGNQGFRVSLKSAALLGLVLGALFLARTDNIFYVLVLFVVTIYLTDSRVRLRHSSALLGMFALVTIPWLLWNWINFGSPVQSSGMAVPYVARANYLQAEHTNADLFLQSFRLFAQFLFIRLDIVGFTIIGFVLVVLNRRDYFQERDPVRREASWIVGLLWIAAIALVFVHTFIRWYPREWYFHTLIVIEIITLCLFLMLPPIRQIGSKVFLALSTAIPVNVLRYVSILLVIGGLIFFMRSQSRLVNIAPYPHQIEMLDAAYWLRDNTSVNARAAAFNAGILGYFSGRPVINLDGAINTAAYTAIIQKELFCLLRETSASYYLDYDPIMLQIYKMYLGEYRCPIVMVQIDEVDRPSTSWNGANIIIYKLE
jgi:hypothetical protein